jgi:peptidoglycan/LPS O-acetylase OafA/YrhL
MATKTMAASSIFGANIEIMLYKKGYFDPDVKKNPLLHLWSLGVE